MPQDGGWPSSADVRGHTEAALTQVMAAGDVARAMWRLLMADHRRQRGRQPEEVARRVVEAARRRQETALDVYVLAAFAAALADAGSSDVAALALIELASLHLRLGHTADALRLIDAADTEDVSEPVRRTLASARAWTVPRPQHYHDAHDQGLDQ